MPDYTAPQRDTLFVMNEVLGFAGHYQALGFEEATPDIVEAILAEYAKVCKELIAPLNQIGDQQGCTWIDGKVKTPDGFKEAYHQYREAGWIGLVQAVEYGGQGLPHSLSTICTEYISSANRAFSMYPGLSGGAMETILAWGTDEHKNAFLPKLVTGEWTGTMCLTESHCGSDLGLIKTKAVINDDGSYSLNGSKVFISAGDHDLSDNIVHIVIARIEGAPMGTKGISLFIVPKFNIDDDGNLLDPNGVTCGSIEHKMGINGNSTCVINFDDAKGFLIGPENRGLNCMFTFMNAARIGVATEGYAVAEASYQGAALYAQERLAMRSLSGPKNQDGPADPIIVHPDVRRMLLTQKSIAEGGRAMMMYLSKQLDVTVSNRASAEEKATAESVLALMTPIAKAFLTETGFEAANHGIQVFGGHGYIHEWGMEQLVRDARISCLYEGTTGIQALDLLARKVLGSQGELLKGFIGQAMKDLTPMASNPKMDEFLPSMQFHLQEWGELTQEVAAKAMKNPDEIGAASVDYLMYAGYVVMAFLWLKMAYVAQNKLDEGTSETDFYQSKLHTARFYFKRMLPRTRSLAETVRADADSLMAMPASQFIL